MTITVEDRTEDLDVVRLAAAFHHLTGSREEEARRRWNVSGPRFWQRVSVLIRDVAIEAELPVEVHQLQRQAVAARRHHRLA